MFKLYIFVGLLAAAYCEESQGKWLTVAVYPKTAPKYPCEKFNLDVVNESFTCTCDGKPATAAVVRTYDDNKKFSEEVVSFRVNKAEDAFPTLSKTCDCGKYKQHFALMYINDDSLVHFEKPANAASEEDIYAYLSVKADATLSQVQDLLKGLGSTGDDVVYLCDNLKP